jgi:hypothetical protein
MLLAIVGTDTNKLIIRASSRYIMSASVMRNMEPYAWSPRGENIGHNAPEKKQILWTREDLHLNVPEWADALKIIHPFSVV